MKPNLILLFIVIVLFSCEKEKEPDFTNGSDVLTLRLITSVSNITNTSARVGGLITSETGTTVKERGVYWGTVLHPEKNGLKLAMGHGTGSFSSDIKGLSGDLTYYVKAYARSSKDTVFGNELSFNTQMKKPCYLELPVPELEFKGTYEYIGAFGDSLTGYSLNVANYNLFPVELFEASPDLPPCGLNTNSARTWVNILDSNGNYIYGFCGLRSPSDLQSIWFGIYHGVTPPSGVYIQLIDRACDITYTSNTIDIP
jgi:hypothetical protein